MADQRYARTTGKSRREGKRVRYAFISKVYPGMVGAGNRVSDRIESCTLARPGTGPALAARRLEEAQQAAFAATPTLDLAVMAFGNVAKRMARGIAR